MKKLLLVPLLLLLAACNPSTQVLTKTKLYVAVPPPDMFVCPILKKYPDPSKLTDVEVAQVLIEQYKNNTLCKNSIDAIQKFLNDQKALMESQSN